MKVLLKPGTAEIVEKKSRFIAHLASVSTPEEANVFFEGIKKQYWDARHNCTAYVIGKDASFTRCNDDGEPAQTAGLPMLEVLLHSEVRNVAVVVTRYFGGTLLGTGGLIRAYGQAVKEALANSEIGEEIDGVMLIIEVEYTQLGKVQYSLAQLQVDTIDSLYEQNVILKLRFQEELLKKVEEELINVTNGKVNIIEREKCSFICKTEIPYSR